MANKVRWRHPVVGQAVVKGAKQARQRVRRLGGLAHQLWGLWPKLRQERKAPVNCAEGALRQ